MGRKLIMEMANTTKQIAEQLRQDAENGLFKGEKGEKGEQGVQGPKGDRGDTAGINVTDDGNGNVTIISVLNNLDGESLPDGDGVSY